MALTGSGQLKFSEMRDEFGGSGQVKFSDLYRGGSLVRANAGNNPSTNLAASVPTSGEIQVADFYGQAKGFRHTYSSGATNQDASNLFGDDYGVDYPKEIVINSGVELGATSTSQEALQIDSGMSGSIKVTNNGTLTGAGGAAGSAGGDALQVDVTCTVINNGVIRSGGGGGGAGGAGGTGGTGGQGRTSYPTTSYGNWGNYSISGGGVASRNHSGTNQSRNMTYYKNNNATPSLQGVRAYYGNTIKATAGYGQTNYNPNHPQITSYNPTVSPVNKIQGTAFGGENNQDSRSVYATYQLRNYSTGTGYNYYNGGSGGSGGSGGGGGVGQGYNQSAGSGSSGSGGSGGSSGSTNAGNGGTGGTGGTGGAGGAYGAAGSTGATGNTGATGGNGNYTNGSGGSSGSSGSSGGAAGLSVRGISNVAGGITGSGSLSGSTG